MPTTTPKAPPVTISMEASGATDLGKKRQHNEDSFVINNSLGLYVVADGMGGHAAGEIASRLAVQSIEAHLQTKSGLINDYQQAAASQSDVLQVISEAITLANETIYAAAAKDSTKQGMGTTVTVLWILANDQGTTAFVGHVGDSRVYVHRDTLCYFVTKDHSLASELIERGDLTPKDLTLPQYRKVQNAVTRAVGIRPKVEVDIFDIALLAGDTLLVCSDGLYNHLSQETLAETLLRPIEGLPEYLIALANKDGGKDNITAVTVRLSEGEKKPQKNALLIRSLRLAPVLKTLSAQELDLVATFAAVIEKKADSLLFGPDYQEKASDALWLLMAGSVTVEGFGVPTRRAGQSVSQGFINPVVFFAEQDIAACHCTTSCQLLRFAKDGFRQLEQHHPRLLAKLLQIILANQYDQTKND